MVLLLYVYRLTYANANVLLLLVLYSNNTVNNRKLRIIDDALCVFNVLDIIYGDTCKLPWHNVT